MSLHLDATIAASDEAALSQEAEHTSRIWTASALSPIVGSASIAIGIMGRQYPDATVQDAMDLIAEAAARVRAGEVGDLESMLVGQAITLNTAFMELARIAGPHIRGNFLAAEKYVRLALKAQAQCRATIEAIAALRQTRTAGSGQTNYSSG